MLLNKETISIKKCYTANHNLWRQTVRKLIYKYKTKYLVKLCEKRSANGFTGPDLNRFERGVASMD